ncbi:hypothetical protein Pla108_04830 [Botrimarina colliarenosi]|uniref:Lacal_2735 family protein n=1 Tax=Botrimarina colliarenosi TaxID=2528001 RepID=A0A5C6AJG2_9BACT|nr:Lacal_2735 family protein [Botrimarina colliarenosi]TWT99540.1 hypothetical protein Pla108_04830 [Botrimarina colliarenosi]
MFGFFSASPAAKKAKLEKRYIALLAEAHRLSTIDRLKSDLVTAEAEEVRQQIEAIEASEAG